MPKRKQPQPVREISGDALKRLAETRTELFAAPVMPDSVDDEKRTIECVFYSGATVDRRDWWTGERYKLRLSMDPAHIRLTRLNDGAPVLDNHMGYSVREQLGVVEKGWLQDGVGRARLRFSNNPEVDGVWNNVKNGITRKVSVGASIYKLEDITPEADRDKRDTIKMYLATDWEPFEISPTPVPADAGAGFLSAQLGRIDASGALMSAAETQTPIERADIAAPQPKETVVEQTQLTTAGAGNDPARPAEVVDKEALKKEARKEENERILEIRKIGVSCKLKATFVDEHVNKFTPLEDFRKLAIDQVAAGYEENPTRAHVTERTTLQITRDERSSRIEAMSLALLHRYRPDLHKLDDGAKQYRGMTLLRLCEECISLGGTKTRGLSAMDIATRGLTFNAQAVVLGVPTIEEFGAMSTSDFPFILANVANKSLRAAYAAEPQTWRPFSRQANASDFKAKYVNQLGDAPSLELVPESGEFKYGSIPEARESYRLYTYGKILPLTRQAIINDDMSAFTRIPELQGRAVARLENDLVWNQITGNPTMGDSVALFHATHANLVTPGTAISVDNLGIARTLMRVQTGLGGTEKLNLTPKFLLVPAAKEQLGLQYTSMNFVPATAANQNVWAGLLTPIVEPRLDAASATAWYVVADPAQIDTIEFAYLEGQEGAYYETRMGFTVDGMELKVRHDFGRKVIDWRAFVMNEGA